MRNCLFTRKRPAKNSSLLIWRNRARRKKPNSQHGRAARSKTRPARLYRQHTLLLSQLHTLLSAVQKICAPLKQHLQHLPLAVPLNTSQHLRSVWKPQQQPRRLPIHKKSGKSPIGRRPHHIPHHCKPWLKVAGNLGNEVKRWIKGSIKPR